MSELYETNMTTPRPWKKVLSVVLSVILAFGTLVTLTVGSSRLQDWLGIKSMLSAYAAEYVDTAGAIAVDKDAMLADPIPLTWKIETAPTRSTFFPSRFLLPMRTEI